MSQLQNKESTLPEEDVAAADTTLKDEKKRTGKGANKKRIDKWRRKQNEYLDQRVQEEDRKWKESFKKYKEESPFSCTPILVTEPISVEISTDSIADVVFDVVDALYSACKLPSAVGQNQDYDAVTLLCATAYQIDAKIAYATQNTQFALRDVWDNHGIHEKVATVMDYALTPLAWCIDNIGKCNPGQPVYPKVQELASLSIQHLPNPENRLNNNERIRKLGLMVQIPTNAYPTGDRDFASGTDMDVYFTVHQRQLAFEARVLITDGNSLHLDLEKLAALSLNERMVLGQYQVFKRTQNVPSVHDIHARYIEFMGRVKRKLTDDVFRPLNIRHATGTAAQLIGSTIFDTSKRRTTSVRPFDGELHFVAAILGFGFEGVSGLHDPDNAFQSAVHEVGAWSKTLANMVLRKVRSTH